MRELKQEGGRGCGCKQMVLKEVCGEWKITPTYVHWGFEGDNLVKRIEIKTDITGYAFKLDVRRNGRVNIIDLQYSDGMLYADLTADMLGEAGEYECQIRAFFMDEEMAHSNIFHAVVRHSINAFNYFPPFPPSEFIQIEQRLCEMQRHPPTPGENGYWLIWDMCLGEYVESDIPFTSGCDCGGGGGGSSCISNIVILEQWEYDALETIDENTMYLIKG